MFTQRGEFWKVNRLNENEEEIQDIKRTPAEALHIVTSISFDTYTELFLKEK